jgi:Protein of unknown function (DUF3352)
MNGPDPNEATSSTDLDPTAAVPVATTPVTPVAPMTPAGELPTNPTPQPYEPAVAWAPAVPVATPSKPRRGGRLRWAAALAVVTVVLGASAAVAALITNSASQATVLGYVPPGTIVYGEVRLDLPGDQRRAAGEFLSKFPGFKDQAALDTKLDEVLDELVKKATDGAQTYTADIEPWFGGEVAFSVGPLPPASSLTTDPASMEAFRALALLSIKDATVAQAWFDAALKESGATTTKETYNGVTLTVISEPDAPKAAYAVLGGKVAVLGDLASVKAAVDTDGHSGFASEPGPKAALASADADHLGFLYVALRPLLDWSTDLSKKASPDTGGAIGSALSDTMLGIVPDWAAYWLKVESDALVMEATAPKPQTAFGPTENRTSNVVDHVPSSALVVSVTHDLGKTLGQVLGQAASDPGVKDMLDQLDGALGLVGGKDAALGWIGDTAVVVNASAGTPEGGLLVVPTDGAAAERLFTALRTFIGLGGSTQGITVHEEPYAGTTITIIDLSNARGLSVMGDAAADLPLPTGPIEIAFAVTDDIVVIGSGPSFVKHVLDTTKATSLASDDQYKELADRAGAGTGTTFVDITAVREMLEKQIATGDPSAKSRYETEIKPFLLPFDAMFASSKSGSDTTSSTVIITVK